jgi:hypothetical protein
VSNIAFRILLHVALVLFVAALFLTHDPVTSLFVGGLASFIVYGYLTWAEVLSSPDALTPLSYHFLWSSVASGVAAVYFSLVVWHTGFTSFDTISYVTASDLALGYLICLVRSSVLHATLRKMAPEPHQTATVQRIVHPIFGLILFIVGVYVIVAPPGLMILAGLPAFLFRYAPVAILLAIAFGSRKRRWFSLKLVTGTTILVTANMLAFFPYKGGVLESLFPLVIAIWKYNRKLALTAVCLVPLFYLGVVAPYVSASRTNLDLNPLARLSQPSPRGESGQFGKLMSRIFEPIEIGFIVSQTRFGGFLNGETMKNIEYALVPRVLWPDKPNMNAGKWFTVYLGFATREEDAPTSTAMTAAGELYWNFALPGVVLGTVIQYLMYGYLWIVAERFGKGTLLGALLWMISVTSNNVGEFSGSVVFVLGIYTLLVLILLWQRFKKSALLLLRFPVLSPPEPAG